MDCLEFLRDASLDWPVPGRSIAGVAVVFAPGCHPPGRDPFRWPPSHAPPLIAPVRVNPFRNATQVNPLRCGSARISLRGARNPARISAGNQYDRWRANYQPRVRVGRGGGLPVLMTSRSSPVSLHHQQSLTILHHPGSCRIIFKPSRGRSISLRSISLRSILGSILHRTGHHVAIAWRSERHLADLFSNSSLPRLHSILRVFLNSFINFLFFLF